MYYLIAFANGIVNAMMTLVNGKINLAAGNYTGTVIIHTVGMLLMLVILAVRRERVRLFPKGIPWTDYLGGVIGVGVVLSSAYAYSTSLGVTQIVGLSLTGGVVMSLIIDCLGLFGMKKRSVPPMKVLGIGIMLCGIVFMLMPLSEFRPLPVLSALLCGILIVLSRSFNGNLTVRLGVMQSTLYNYITGLSVSIIVMLLLGRGEPLWNGASLPKELLWYTGGILGVISVTIFNVVIHKISALYLTVLQFIGQVSGGFLFDAMLGNGLSAGKLIGGLFCAVGMMFNVWADRRQA